jgi:DNA-binding Xre family transcriptional regulator
MTKNIELAEEIALSAKNVKKLAKKKEAITYYYRKNR